jgi:hypothetical protein
MKNEEISTYMCMYVYVKSLFVNTFNRYFFFFVLAKKIEIRSTVEYTSTSAMQQTFETNSQQFIYHKNGSEPKKQIMLITIYTCLILVFVCLIMLLVLTIYYKCFLKVRTPVSLQDDAQL